MKHYRLFALLFALCLALAAVTALAEEPKAAAVAINSRNFPAKALRTYVKKHFDTNKDGKLSAAERNKVKTISLFRYSDYDKGKGPQPCKTMKGIEFFPNLKTLYCEDCGVETLDVSKNTKLTRLFCEGNNLRKLDVSKNRKLVELHCEVNLDLTKLDVTRNTRLQKLDCYNCAISALNLTKCPNLTVLICTTNPIKKLDVTKNPKLKSLNCAGTGIARLDVSKNPKLRRLYCNGLEKLTKLDLSKNPNLATLYAGYTGIKKLDIANNRGLLKAVNNGKIQAEAADETIYWGSDAEDVAYGISINRTHQADRRQQDAVQGQQMSRGDRFPESSDFPLRRCAPALLHRRVSLGCRVCANLEPRTIPLASPP